MNELDYRSKLNKNTIECWILMAVMLTVGYIVEFLQSHIQLSFLFVFLLLIHIPLIIACNIYRKVQSSMKIEYISAIGYMIFYTFALFMARSIGNWVYIFPLASVVITYVNRRVILGVFGYACIANFIATTCELSGIIHQQYDFILLTERRLACILLTLIFVYKSAKILGIKSDILSDAWDDIYEDALTGLKNVRFIEDSLSNRFDYKKNDVFNIAFIDIDDFKQFNTKYGHAIGDNVLKSTAMIFLKYVTDVPHTYAIRNGGDEFVIISRTMSSTNFINLMKKMQNEIYKTKFEFLEEGDGISISIGVATKTFDKHCKSFNCLLRLADERNQIAKNSGKNLVISSSGDKKLVK